MPQPENPFENQELLLPEIVHFDQRSVFDGVRRAVQALRLPTVEPVSTESEALIETAVSKPEDIEQN